MSQHEQLPQIFTHEQVKQLTKEGRVIVMLFSWVYDLTDFYLMHPGGKKIIQKSIGKDATELFVNEGHLKNK